MNKYWMVQIVDGGSPVAKYPTHKAAVDRAKQLADLTSSRVVILEAVEILTPEITKSVTYFLEPLG